MTKLVKYYYNCINQSYARFGPYYSSGPTCQSGITVLLCMIKAQTHLSKKHQMHVILFCQDSILFFSNGKTTPYPIEQWHIPTSATIKEWRCQKRSEGHKEEKENELQALSLWQKSLPTFSFSIIFINSLISLSPLKYNTLL